jgi:dienelactone hydrolase
MNLPLSKAAILLLVLLVTTSPSANAVDTVNRSAAYKDAIGLYKYDINAPLDVQITYTKKYQESYMLRLTYAGGNGVRVPAVFYEPLKASAWKPVPCLILLHGLGGSKEQLVPLGRFAAATGYACLIIDEYGHGERKAPPSSIPTNPSATQAEMIDGMRQTILDVRRGIDFIKSRDHINPKRIGILGFSLGAIIAVDVAGIDNRVKATVLISGGGDLSLILKNLAEHDTSVGGHKMEAFKNTDWTMASLLLAPEDPLTFAAHIAPRALLMQSGRADKIIPPDATKELFQAASKPKNSHAQIDWYDSGHVPGLDLVYPRVRVWLLKNL